MFFHLYKFLEWDINAKYILFRQRCVVIISSLFGVVVFQIVTFCKNKRIVCSKVYTHSVNFYSIQPFLGECVAQWNGFYFQIRTVKIVSPLLIRVLSVCNTCIRTRIAGTLILRSPVVTYGRWRRQTVCTIPSGQTVRDCPVPPGNQQNAQVEILIIKIIK